jgi:hypothetical protein
MSDCSVLTYPRLVDFNLKRLGFGIKGSIVSGPFFSSQRLLKARGLSVKSPLNLT